MLHLYLLVPWTVKMCRFSVPSPPLNVLPQTWQPGNQWSMTKKNLKHCSEHLELDTTALDNYNSYTS